MAVFADCLIRRETRTSIPTKTALTREGNSKKTSQRHLFMSYVHFFYRTRDKFLLNPFNLASLSLL